MSLPVLHSLWVGDKLKYLERLCLATATKCGHEFVLWSYEPEQLQGVPDNVELRNAADVMPRDKLATYAGSGYVSLGANLWRYELLSKGFGSWVDMDLIFLKPFDFDDEYVFGRQADGQVNNAVLFAPEGSKFTQDLPALARANRLPPWFGPKATLKYFWKRLTHGKMELGDYPWATFGPGLLNYAVKKHGLTSNVKATDVFYPIDWPEASLLYGPSDEVERRITPDTYAIHMWHGALKDLKFSPPPAGSYMEAICRENAVDTSW